MDRHFEDACSLLAIVVLLPIMLLVVLPATFLFDEHIGWLRGRHSPTQSRAARQRSRRVVTAA